jgi:calcineurin-like phosphoesterase family protein
MKTWLTADLHLGEDRFHLLGRPFRSQAEYLDRIIENFNSRIMPDDYLIINGDAIYQHTPKYLPKIALINGKKVLIRGNHERDFTDEQLAPYFESIIPEGDGLSLTVENLHCYITHYPTRGKPDKFNLVGHVHDMWKYQLNMFNVGVDVHHFFPVDLDSIPGHYNEICSYFDDDVWAAYSPINVDYRQTRGKKGSYFQPCDGSQTSS